MRINIKKIEFPIAFLLFTTMFLYFFITSGAIKRHTLYDFKAYLTGAELVRNGDIKNLYDYDTQKSYQDSLVGKIDAEKEKYDNLLSFRNPPIMAYMFVPFTYMQPEHAFITFTILSFVFFGFAIYAIWDKESIPMYILLFLPILFTLVLGQITTLILLFLALAYKYKDKYFLSGFLSGLLFLKVQWIVFCMYFFLYSKDKIKYLGGLFLSLLIQIGLCTLSYGKTFIYDYAKFLLKSEGSLMGTNINGSYNLGAFYAIFTAKENMSLLVVIISAICFLGFSFLTKKLHITESQDEEITSEIRFSIIIFLGLILNIHTMPGDLIFLLIPISTAYYLHAIGNKNKRYVFFILLMFLAPITTFPMLQWVGTLMLAWSMFLLLDIPLTKKLFEP